MTRRLGLTFAKGTTHSGKLKVSCKSAFTLAEVLITLGIIGVVAAMTMPTLMNSTNGAQYKTAYKKALSVLSQAVVLNVALDDYDLSQTTAGTGSGSIYSLFNERMNVIKPLNGGEGSDNDGWAARNDSSVKFGQQAAAGNYTLFFNDGVTFNFDSTNEGCTDGHASQDYEDRNHCYGFIDVNGAKNPNQIVKCDKDEEGEHEWDDEVENCTVSNPTDIYPVVFYDQSVLPKTDAAEAVLYGGK